ncbi:hypothetical protein BDV23DRAFT_149597 [Aspergillus alliaceus]|uniref:Uncharacterized protein n=1 Tax=Petromyces alliaceus TaxID=209559 RepID=A0A5N7CH51_PETAA|nr:hypothetical protein BDV23DRAFT_149597 [Aspergillus alliaceus]
MLIFLFAPALRRMPAISACPQYTATPNGVLYPEIYFSPSSISRSAPYWTSNLTASGDLIAMAAKSKVLQDLMSL